MRILILGAGGVGGYFGGRLAEAGRDVTFLVRPGRAEHLKREGLVIRSVFGDAGLTVRTILSGQVETSFDLVILSAKAYDMDSSLDAIAPAVGSQTAVLPLLNGFGHIETLIARFGEERVLGGTCFISSTLDASGTVLHLNDRHEVRFGELRHGLSARVDAIAQLMRPAKMVSRASAGIVQEMWEKWVMLATLAGIMCLMRASVGDIVAAPGGEAFTLQLLAECIAVAEADGHAPRPEVLEPARQTLTAHGSTFSASMLRDLERGGPTEANHVIGGLIARAEHASIATPLLRIAWCHLNASAHRRARAAAEAK
ncbi:MAG: 2-dehydropantoate 2-reductase [Bryobacteraceae bacterium]